MQTLFESTSLVLSVVCVGESPAMLCRLNVTSRDSVVYPVSSPQAEQTSTILSCFHIKNIKINKQSIFSRRRSKLVDKMDNLFPFSKNVLLTKIQFLLPSKHFRFVLLNKFYIKL